MSGSLNKWFKAGPQAPAGLPQVWDGATLECHGLRPHPTLVSLREELSRAEILASGQDRSIYIY